MKAIVQKVETELENKDGLWLPKDGSQCEITRLSENKIFMVVNGRSYTAILLEMDRATKTLEIMLNSKKATVQVKEPLDDLLHAMGLDKLASAKVENIKAPMPGLVLDVAVEPGAAVKKGDKVLVLEAMKMENIIKSAGDGIVARILVQKGQTVDKNQVLVEFS